MKNVSEYPAKYKKSFITKRCIQCKEDKELTLAFPIGRDVCWKCVKKEKPKKEVKKKKKIEYIPSFSVRNITLEKLGYKTYSDYLESSLWKKIRMTSFSKNKGGKCQLCNNVAQIIHHRRYDKSTLIGENYEWLSPLCNICHQEVEFKDGIKRTTDDAEYVFQSKYNYRRLTEPKK